MLLQGRLWDQAPEIDGNLYITDGSAVTGGIYDVKINEFNGADFFGEIVSGSFRAADFTVALNEKTGFN